MRFSNALCIILIIIVSSVSVGCDTTAERELRRAEAALDDAVEVDAEEHATDDFKAADELFQEAMEHNEDGRIQEARTAAIKSKLRAEDAMRKAEERLRVLNQEHDQLGR